MKLYTDTMCTIAAVYKYMLGTTAVVLELVSCTNVEFPTTETHQGTMSLTVDKVQPNAARTIETANFQVAIHTPDGREYVSFERADQVPDRITLPVGRYYAEANTPSRLEKIMDAPYYLGRDEFEILQGVNTISTVNCRMANGSVTVAHTEDFKNIFSECTVTVDDGKGLAVIYQASEGTGYKPATHYVCYEEGTKVLYVNVVAKAKDSGYRSTNSFTLTKNEAQEQYDDDKAYFAGGDCLVIYCEPSMIETTEGSIVGITISANVQFEESEENFEMDVEDYIPEDDEGGSEGGDVEDGSDAITLTLPDDMVVSDVTDPSLGNTYIVAEYGIQSIQVKMSSTSDAMMDALASLIANYEGVDFITGAEVVENQNMVALFNELNQPLDVPSVGDKEYTFPIGNFFSLLAVLPGEHSFMLNVTDVKGNVKHDRLTLTVNEP